MNHEHPYPDEMPYRRQGGTERPWSFTLRLLGRNPEQVTMDRLAEYMSAMANLLGTDNHPVLHGIKRASTGIQARLPREREHYAAARIGQGKNNPTSPPGRQLAKIQNLIDEDDIQGAQLFNRDQKIIALFTRQPVETIEQPTIQQTGTVDGIVTGLVGSDDTMHLHLRDWMDRDLKILVRDESIAREMLRHFRGSTLRVTVSGSWKRTEDGWVPENNKVSAQSYEVLEDTPLTEIFARFAAVPGNGWKEMEDPQRLLAELRGDEE